MVLFRLAILIAAALLFGTTVLSKEDHKVYVRGVQCNMSRKFVFPNMTCFAKSYSRTFSGVNVAAFAVKPLYDIQVKISFVMNVVKFIFNNFR